VSRHTLSGARSGRSSALWLGANLRRIQAARPDKARSVDREDPFIAPIVLLVERIDVAVGDSVSTRQLLAILSPKLQ